MTRWLAVAAALALVSPAAAAPKGAAAKASFDRGVAAYQKGDFAAAAEALGTSYKAEPDIETLFAWAQSERQLEHCDKAIELFTKLLGHDMPAENKKVVQSKIDECKEIIAAKQPKEPKEPKAPKEPDPTEKPAKPDQPEAIAKPPPVEKPHPTSGRSPWWKDPLGDGLTGLGVVGIGVGGYFLVTGYKAHQDAQSNIANFDQNKVADTNGKRGVIATAVGGALLVGGIIRYATRGGGSKEQRTVTGWLTPDGGGIAAIGRF